MTGRRRTVAAAVALVALVAAVTALVLGTGDDTGDDDADDALAGVDISALDGDARELVLLAMAGTDVPHHATYEQSDGSVYETWVDGDRLREEIIPTDGERRLLLETGDERIRCTGASPDGWTCEEPASTEPHLQRQIERLVVDVAGATVEASDDVVAGESLRCFAVSGTEGDVEICLTRGGVVGRLVAGGEKLVLTRLDRRVNEDAFTAP